MIEYSGSFKLRLAIWGTRDGRASTHLLLLQRRRDDFLYPYTHITAVSSLAAERRRYFNHRTGLHIGGAFEMRGP